MSKVSIVCAAYNCDKYLSDTVNSVLGQDYENWELFIINDYSTDQTLQIAQRLSNLDSRIIILNNKSNMGPAKTRNRGIKSAKGKYLTFLDSDDLWKKNFLSRSISFLKKQNCTFCFSSYYRVDEQLNPVYEPTTAPKKVNYNDLLKTCPIGCLAVLIDIDRIGKYYMPDIEKRQDYGLWLKILKDVEYAYGINEPLAIYRMRENSISRNKFKAMFYVWKLFRDVEKFNFFKSLYFTTIYGLNGLRKYS